MTDTMTERTENGKWTRWNKLHLGISVVMVVVFMGSCHLKNENQQTKEDTAGITLTEAQQASLDSTVLYLLEVSARDFYDNQPPLPADFRKVQVRCLTVQNQVSNYLICGQFLTIDNTGIETWTDFATIRTDPYEQWIGSNARVYCQDSKPISYKTDDLSSALKSSLDSLRDSK